MFIHYTMNQVVLPLELEIKCQENDIAFAIHDLVESIPDEAFEDFLRYWATSLSSTDAGKNYIVWVNVVREKRILITG